MVSNLLSPFMSQPGTYLYHAHYGMQREAGLYGMMRVAPRDPEPFAYDLDRSIILNDWYHSSTYEQAAGLSSIPFRWVGEPQVNILTVQFKIYLASFFLFFLSSIVYSLCIFGSSVTSDSWKRNIQLLKIPKLKH